jgi:hypothetical protein
MLAETKPGASPAPQTAGTRAPTRVASAAASPAKTRQVAAPRPVPTANRTAHFVPDFRGESVTSALMIAARDSFTLELEGDHRGLAVEQHPEPGTVVHGERPSVTLRFTLVREEG